MVKIESIRKHFVRAANMGYSKKCVCVCLSVCLYVRLGENTHTHTHRNTHAHTHTQTHTLESIRKHFVRAANTG